MLFQSQFKRFPNFPQLNTGQTLSFRITNTSGLAANSFIMVKILLRVTRVFTEMFSSKRVQLIVL